MMLGAAILVRCDAGAVKTAIETWLTSLSLDAPAGLVLDVVITDDALPEVTDFVFEQPDVRFARGADGRGLIVVWMEAPAVAVLSAADTTASIRLSGEAARQMDLCIRTFMMSVLIVLLRRVGWYHLHAATAIDPQGRGWLIAGNTHAGKSTTAALLAANGWRVGADDAAWLARRDHRVVVHTPRASIALREDGHRLLARDGGVQLTDRGKVGYTPEDLGGIWTPLVDPEIVIFTAVGTSSTSAHPLDRRSALAELVRWSAWVVLEPDLAQAHLDVLTSLTRQTRTFRVTLGRDLFAHPNRLIELIT